MKKKAQFPFTDPHFKQDPYPFLAQIRQNGPAYKTVLPSGVEVYLVTRFEDVQAGLKDARLVKNVHNVRPKGRISLGLRVNNASMLKADPPEHTRLRALAHEAFTPKFVNQLRGHIQQIADELLDAVQARGKMDLIADYAFPLPITVISEMLGVPAKDHQKFRQWSSDLIASGILSAESPLPPPELFRLLRYVKKLIDQRRKTPSDDLISRLIHVEQGGDHLNETELLGTTLVLLIAGHETTVNLIGNGALALLQNPSQIEALKRSPELIKPAAEELLRYVNPAQWVNRYAAEDLEIGGVAIPKGAHLLMVVAAANHDAAYVEQPETLNLAQGNTKHLAFGQGIHYCLGAPLARLEGEIAFTTLLKRCPDLRLNCAPEDLRWRPTQELRGLKALPVVF